MGINIKVDSSGLSKLIETLQATPATIAKVAVLSVNNVGQDAYSRSKSIIPKQVNLPQAYVDQRMSFVAATLQKPTATITAKDSALPLSRYNAQQVLAVAPKAKGDKGFRKIGKGFKEAGIRVNVKTGKAPVLLKHAFFLPLRAGSVAGGNGLGVFEHVVGQKKMKHLIGPSIDQVFKGVAQYLQPSVADELEKEVTRQIDIEMGKL